MIKNNNEEIIIDKSINDYIVNADYTFVSLNRSKIIEKITQLCLSKKAPYKANEENEGIQLGHKLYDYLSSFPEEYRDLIAKELGYKCDLSISENDFVMNIVEEVFEDTDTWMQYPSYEEWEEKDNIDKVLDNARSFVEKIDGGVEKFAEDAKELHELESIISENENYIEGLENDLKSCEEKYEKTKDEDYKEDIDDLKDEIKEYDDALKAYETDRDNIIKKYDDFDGYYNKLQVLFDIDDFDDGIEFNYHRDLVMYPEKVLENINSLSSKDVYQELVDLNFDHLNSFSQRVKNICEKAVPLVLEELDTKSENNDIELLPNEKETLKKIVLKNQEAYDELDSIDRDKIDSICDIDRFQLNHQHKIKIR